MKPTGLHKKNLQKISKFPEENEILLGDKIDKDKMQKMAAMDKSMGHSHSNSVLLAPKEKGILIWKFENAVDIEVACNVPGHYQAGMIAAVNLD